MPHAGVCDAVGIYGSKCTSQRLTGGVAVPIINIGQITTTSDIVQIAVKVGEIRAHVYLYRILAGHREKSRPVIACLGDRGS